MGSGSSGLYFGTRGGSQPYALSYSVTPQMLEEDKKDPIYMVLRRQSLMI